MLIGTYYGNSASSGRFRIGVDVQYSETDPARGYHIQYKVFIDVLKKATTTKYFTEYMRCTWTTKQYACGDKIGRVGESDWIDGGWVQFPNQFELPTVACWYYSTTQTHRSELSGQKVPMPGALMYKVYFNANGGVDGPGEIVGSGEITIPSTVPTRTGYNFIGWSKTSTGSVDYTPGGIVTEEITLYAVWSANTYLVSYNANGGIGEPGNQTKTYGKTLVLSSETPLRNNYDFLGWATEPGGNAIYQPGGGYTKNETITLYAIWKQRANGYMKFENGWEAGMIYQKFSDGWHIVEAYTKDGSEWKKSGV